LGEFFFSSKHFVNAYVRWIQVWINKTRTGKLLIAFYYTFWKCSFCALPQITSNVHLIRLPGSASVLAFWGAKGIRLDAFRNPERGSISRHDC
jgi:hypothetical protein